MVDVKEISSIKIVPFTLMISTVSAIIALIFGLITAIFLGVIVSLLPQEYGGALAGLGVASIIAFPILTFLILLSVIFMTVILYNWLVPKVGGVKLAMDGNRISGIPVISLVIIISVIGAIWAFIIGLVLATGIAPITGIIGTSIPLIANMTNATLNGAVFGAFTVYLYVFLIIGLPILTFIGMFIHYALFGLFYNYIIVKANQIQLNLSAVSKSWYELTSIPIMPAAISFGLISAIFGLIQGIATLALSMSNLEVFGVVIEMVFAFVYTFIIVAIATALYNWLAPKIGAIKLELQ